MKIEFTLSKILAFIIVAIGTALSFVLHESVPFDIAVGGATVLMGVKTVSDVFTKRNEVKYRQEPNVDTDR